ncbi:hypothetical protein Tco_0859038 [Tanacetum coccineum]|uniref:Uncharacterized protein n=1 Tax=Tanacetum coccineum TaxID=301880 RepID=A0ABQ5BBM4_9ASTR
MLNKKLKLFYWNEMKLVVSEDEHQVMGEWRFVGTYKTSWILRVSTVSTAGEKVYAAELQLLEDLLLSRG